MEPIYYQPDGDPERHKITAEVIEDDPHGLTFQVQSDGEQIGEVDLDLLSETKGFISGVGPGEKINNGYLRPACFAIVACMADRKSGFQGLYNDDEVIVLLQ